MTKPKASILICLFCFGGNGGVSSIIPEIAIWLVKTVLKLRADPRIGDIGYEIISETPITLSRNRAIKMAQERGFDMVLMIDSDNEPDAYVGRDAESKPFVDVAIDFAYPRLMQGIPTVIAAPYCGPPPNPCPPPGIIDGGEVPYLFEWTDNETADDTAFKIEILNRREAARLRGVFPMAALPTGVCLFTLNAFEGMKKPYFAYDFSEDGSEKKSTEDVYATRNIAMYWWIKKKIDVIFAACDSWALHHKPKKVGKPFVITQEAASEKFREAILENGSCLDTKQDVDFTSALPNGWDKETIVEKDETPKEEMLRLKLAVDEEFPEEPTDIEPDEETYVGDPVKSNGQATKLASKMVAGKRVAIVDEWEIADQDLDSLRNMTSWLCSRNENSSLEVAVVHSGSGQGAAAILSELPVGSHLYALDSLLVYKFKKDNADQFDKAFSLEIEKGIVMPDNRGRRNPYPSEPHALDLVFFERFISREKMAVWHDQLQPAGMMAGLEYEKHKLAIQDFAQEKGMKLQTEGEVWALVA